MANDNNNAKNLEALAKLKELGITDLSPEAVLTMVQSHLDTQSNLRKDNCQKQKEIDAKKAEIDYLGNTIELEEDSNKIDVNDKVKTIEKEPTIFGRGT